VEKNLTLVVRGLELPERLATEIDRRIAGLEHFYPRLIGCSVIIEGPGRHHRTGGPYAVQIELRVPGAEPLLVARQSQEAIERAIDDAFDVAGRRLEDFARVQRGKVERNPRRPSRPRRPVTVEKPRPAARARAAARAVKPRPAPE